MVLILALPSLALVPLGPAVEAPYLPSRSRLRGARHPRQRLWIALPPKVFEALRAPRSLR